MKQHNQKFLQVMSLLLVISLISNPCYCGTLKSITFSDNTKQEEQVVEEQKQESNSKIRIEERKAEQEAQEKAEAEKKAQEQAKLAQAYQNLLKQYEALAAQQQAQAQANAIQQQQNEALQQELIFATTPVDYQGHWVREAGYWYFYDDKNQKLKNKWINGDKIYYVDNEGKMLTGWQWMNKNWYCFDKNGASIRGWYDEGNNKYYLDPETGIMAVGLVYIDGVLCMFNEDGTYIKDPKSEQKYKLANVMKGRLKFLNNHIQMKQTGVEDGLKKDIIEVLESLPQDVLSRLVADVEYIYIFTHEDEVKKNWLRFTAKQEDGDTTYEYLPFTATKKTISLNGNKDVKYLYYAIGDYIAQNYTYQSQKLMNSTVWKAIYNNPEELDCLTSLSGDEGLDFYFGDARAALASSIGWFLINPVNLEDANPSVRRLLGQIIDITRPNPLVGEMN